MKAKRLLLFIAELTILFLWGVEITIRFIIWIFTWTYCSSRLRSMWFAKLYTWIQRFRPYKPKYRYYIDPYDRDDKSNSYDPWNHIVLVLPILFLFSCNDGMNIDHKEFRSVYGNICYIDYQIIDNHVITIIEGPSSLTAYHSPDCPKCKENESISPQISKD